MKTSVATIMTMGLLTLFSCGKKVYINNEILEIITNVYDEGDVLVFQNIATQETDTSTITKIEVYHNDYDWFRHDGYQPHQAKVWYKNKRLKYGEDNQNRIISSEKRKPRDKDWIGLSYLNSSFYMEREDLTDWNIVTLESIPKTFNKVYIINPSYKSKDDFSPQTLYWDREYGIIKYITYDGEVWERINW